MTKFIIVDYDFYTTVKEVTDKDSVKVSACLICAARTKKIKKKKSKHFQITIYELNKLLNQKYTIIIGKARKVIGHALLTSLTSMYKLLTEGVLARIARGELLIYGISPVNMLIKLCRSQKPEPSNS